MKIYNNVNNVSSYTKSSPDKLTESKQLIKREDSYTPSIKSVSHPFVIDKLTAIETTIHVSRKDYDRILNAAVNQNEHPIECGKDMNKRWVVIDGQRFENELTPEEKKLMRDISKTLIDYLLEAIKKEKDEQKNITATSDIKSCYLQKKYGSNKLPDGQNDVVYNLLTSAGF